MSALEAAREICKYLGSGNKLIMQDLMQSVTEISEIIARHEPELSALRAAAAECDEWKQRHAMLLDVEVGFIRERDRLQAVVTAQAAQLEQARILISAVAYGSWAPDNVRPEYRVWMYSNAPAPEEERTA